jgi:NADH-quinone oxidoreductase subunit G
MGAKSDLEIISLLAKEMRCDWAPPTPETVFQEIRRLVLGYDLPLAVVETGGMATTTPATGELTFRAQPELVRSSGNTLFTSGTLGKYSNMLNSVMESPGSLYQVANQKGQETAPLEPAGKNK